MTNREFFVAVANANISAELTTKANDLVAALDKRNDDRKGKLTKEQKANLLVIDAIKDTLVAPMTAAEIAQVQSISTQKASALLRKMVADGIVTVADVKVKGKGTVKQYTLVATDTEEGE